ncbi:hypothetical protein, partial [Microbulbifer agarilyticus]|uniref:hypothetical protein n=1 Tax=Microbulbifer agarilyticus TaxID=260552 RepID=UPI001CD433FB
LRACGPPRDSLPCAPFAQVAALPFLRKTRTRQAAPAGGVMAAIEMIKTIYISIIVLWSSLTYASPPCGIVYEVTDASRKMEHNFSKLSDIYYSNGEDLIEVHISLPNNLRGAELGVVSLELEDHGESGLVVSVKPYNRDPNYSNYFFSINQELKTQLTLSVVYNFHEKCRNVEVPSKGFRYHPIKP